MAQPQSMLRYIRDLNQMHMTQQSAHVAAGAGSTGTSALQAMEEEEDDVVRRNVSSARSE